MTTSFPRSVSIVLTAHNNIRYTALAIASLRQTYPGVEIIVVDHNSSDETETYVRRQVKLLNRIKYVRLDGPVNLARSWNKGVEQASGRYVVVSNNDVIFSNGCLEPMLAALAHPHVAVAIPVESTVRLPDSSRLKTKLFDEFNEKASRFEPTGEIAGKLIGHVNAEWNALRARYSGKTKVITDPYYLHGGFCFMIDRHKLTASRAMGDNFFNEQYDYYGEDWDFFSRVMKTHKLVACHDSLVWHFKQTTGGKLPDRFDRLMKARFQLIEDHEGRKELVSIVVPVYNRTHELQVALSSILRQTFKDWRVYVVCDGYEQDMAIGSLCQAFNDPRIGMWTIPKTGPGGARNHALVRTRGKYVAFLDSDDEWEPDHLHAHVELLERSLDVEWSYSTPKFAWRWFDGKGGQVRKQDKHPTISYLGEFDAALLEQQNYIQTSGVVAWGDLARRCCFSDKTIGEDWDYFKELAKRAKAKHLKTCTVTYYQQPNNPGEMIKHNVLPVKAPELDDKSLSDAKVRLKSAKITVVIPTKNRLESLVRAISSVGKVCEVIVVDDHSADTARLREVLAGFDHVWLYQSMGVGPSAARNLGVSKATTPWVKFLDDDDVLIPGWYQQLQPALNDYDLLTVDSAAAAQGKIVILGPDDTYTSQLAIRRKAFEELGGFDELLFEAEERDLIARAVTQNLKTLHLPGPGVLRMQAGGAVKKQLSHITGFSDGESLK